MTYMEFIIGVENNIAKANCNKLNIGEYEEKQKQIYKQIRADAINDYYRTLNEKIKTDTNLKDTIRDIHDNVAREMYCKGIDDFMKVLITMYERYDIDAVFESSDTYSYTNACYIFEHYIKEIAEQLKEQNK